MRSLVGASLSLAVAIATASSAVAETKSYWTYESSDTWLFVEESQLPLRRSGLVRYAFKAVLKTKSAANLSWFVNEVEFDCSSAQGRSLKLILFKDGQVEGVIDDTPDPWQAIHPTSFIARVRDHACGKTAATAKIGDTNFMRVVSAIRNGQW